MQPDQPSEPRRGSGPDPGDWELIASYAAGMASPAERAQVEMRMRSDAEFRSQVEEARTAWEVGAGAFGGRPTPEDAARVWSQLTARIQAAAPGDGTLPARTRRKPAATAARPFAPHPALARFRLLAVAAAVVSLLALSASWIIPRLRPPLTTAAATAREIIAEPGSIRNVRLDDGTRVWIAPEGQLRIPAAFGSARREVLLIGRAYFDVAHDPKRPFIIHAGGMRTRVLGTEFEVRAYPDAPEVDVVVRSGRVAVRAAVAHDTASRVLARGNGATLGPDGDLRTWSIANVDAALAWIHGSLVFDRTPLQEVAEELERWAKVRIHIAEPSLGHLRLTAAFEGESLDEVLDVIARLLEVRVERRGHQVVISPQ